MRNLGVKKIHEFYRRMKYRSWINSQLQQAGGNEYLKRLEIDIGVEPGHFRRELEGGIIPRKKFRGGGGAAGLHLRLPPMRAFLKKA